MPTSQSARVRAWAASARGSKSESGRSDAKPRSDRLRRERRDPEPADRLAAAGRLVDVAEDQLALAPGVGGAHDLGRRRGRAGPASPTRELVLRPLRDDERPLGREQGEVRGRPALPLRPDLLRLGEATRWPMAQVTT